VFVGNPLAVSPVGVAVNYLLSVVETASCSTSRVMFYGSDITGPSDVILYLAYSVHTLLKFDIVYFTSQILNLCSVWLQRKT
jgi:hypothetical protein